MSAACGHASIHQQLNLNAELIQYIYRVDTDIMCRMTLNSSSNSLLSEWYYIIGLSYNIMIKLRKKNV